MRAANGLWAALALILLPGDSHALREGDCEGELASPSEGLARLQPWRSPWGIPGLRWLWRGGELRAPQPTGFRSHRSEGWLQAEPSRLPQADVSYLAGLLWSLDTAKVEIWRGLESLSRGLLKWPPEFPSQSGKCRDLGVWTITVQ